MTLLTRFSGRLAKALWTRRELLLAVSLSEDIVLWLGPLSPLVGFVLIQSKSQKRGLLWPCFWTGRLFRHSSRKPSDVFCRNFPASNFSCQNVYIPFSTISWSIFVSRAQICTKLSLIWSALLSLQQWQLKLFLTGKCPAFHFVVESLVSLWASRPSPCFVYTVPETSFLSVTRSVRCVKCLCRIQANREQILMIVFLCEVSANLAWLRAVVQEVEEKNSTRQGYRCGEWYPI